MDIDEVYALLDKKIDEVKTVCDEIRKEVKTINGQCRDNKWNMWINRSAIGLFVTGFFIWLRSKF